MVKNYFKVAIRNLIKYKSYSIIYISGLSVGLACFFLIMIFVRDELSYDKHFTNANNIYRIYSDIETTNGSQITAQSPPGWARYLLTDYPEVVNVTRVKPPQQWWKVVYEEKIFYEAGWTFIDSSAFDMFDFRMIEGDSKKALSEPYQVILNEKMASKYFGEDDPIGKTFRLDNVYDFTVTGVFEKLPNNTHFNFDFLASFVTLRDSIYGVDLLQVDNFPSAYTYVQLQETSNPAIFESKLPAIIEQYIGSREELAQSGYKIDAYLQPITDIHLYSHLENEIQPNTRISTIYIFIAIALFILLIAGINFMNLSTARSLRRAKEVGLRKTVGANKMQLMVQFLGEAVLISFIALIISIILVVIILPYFSILVNKEIDYSVLLDPISILYLVGFTLLIGLLSGLYPAIFISSYKPTEVLKGAPGSTRGKGGLLRKTLIVFQFAISILLVINTGILYRQMMYIRDFDVGLNQEQILVVQLTDPVIRARYRGFKNRVKQIPSVKNVSASFSAPADLVNQAAFRTVHAAPDENWLSHYFGIDFDFLETLGIQMVAGRDLSHDNAADTIDAVILNETAVKAFGWKSPEEAIGEQVEIATNNPNARPFNIIGVVKDFHMQSVHENISPMVMRYWNVQGFQYSYIDIGSEISGSLKQVEQVWNEVMPNYPFQFAFLDDNFNKLYTTEQTLGKLLTYFAILTIFIACLGLYGLASFTVEQRTKEIGVRKVLGASESQLVLKLSNEYTLLIFAAFIISSPVAYYFMNIWLQSFEYHIDMKISTFVISLLFALVVSWITVSYQSFKAATNNPINSLRSE